jgi:hypothetical protein
MNSSRSLQVEPSTDRPLSTDPRKRPTLKSAKSLGGNDFRSQLDHSPVTSVNKIDGGGDKRGTISMISESEWLPTGSIVEIDARRSQICPPTPAL